MVLHKLFGPGSAAVLKIVNWASEKVVSPHTPMEVTVGKLEVKLHKSPENRWLFEIFFFKTAERISTI